MKCQDMCSISFNNSLAQFNLLIPMKNIWNIWKYSVEVEIISCPIHMLLGVKSWCYRITKMMVWNIVQCWQSQLWSLTVGLFCHSTVSLCPPLNYTWDFNAKHDTKYKSIPKKLEYPLPFNPNDNDQIYISNNPSITFYLIMC